MGPRRRSATLTVLVYHAIADGMGDEPEQMTVSRSLFARQMDWLGALGYAVVPLHTAVEQLIARRLDVPLVSLTFDDGYRSTYTHAFPVLQERGYPATVFLVPGALTGAAPRGALPRRFGPLLSWSEAREMSRHGISFGAHGMTHRKLSGLPAREIQWEVGDSKRSIEDALGAPVTEFAYPFGSFDSFTPVTEAVVRASGFTAVCTTIAGQNAQPADAQRLKRLRISWADRSMREMDKQCSGAYNWYALYQRCHSFGRRRRPIHFQV
jgi:peptidoglycan/xylan/chitin deacetylase (PgdA/CDA1 family)